MTHDKYGARMPRDQRPTGRQIGPHGVSLIDLILTNVPNKFTLQGPGLPLTPKCDHSVIFGQMAVSFNIPTPYTRTMWFYNQIDTDIFTQTMSSVPWTICYDYAEIFEDVDMTYTCWQELFTSAIENAIPHRTVKIFPGNKPWFRKDHHRMRTKVNRLYKHAVKSKDGNDWAKYKQLRNSYKSFCERSKLDYSNEQQRILTTTNSSSKQWWKVTKEILGRSSINFIPPLISKNTICYTNVEKAELFSKHFSEVFKTDETPVPFPPITILDNEPILENVSSTPQQIAKIINRFSPDKSAGPDQITARMLKLSAHYISDSLSRVINLSLLQGSLPDALKRANVPPLFKQNDKHDPSNYRGISLLSLVSKVFERVVFIQLYEFLENKGFFVKFQSGFRKGDSTVLQLLDIVNTLYNSFDNDEEVLGVFLDMSKAFDKVWHKGLIYKLERAGVRGNLLNWLKSYLSGRTMRVVIEGQYSEWKNIEAGVPQGSILGPLLFLIYINDIADEIESDPHTYADDTNLLKPFKNVDDAVQTINRDLNKIVAWAQKWKVTMNPSKTKCVLFSNKRKPSKITNVQLLGKQIPVVTEVKHLGVILDHKLTWQSHINSVIVKANRALGPIHMLKSKLPSWCLLRYYKTFVRPILEYASPVWSGCNIQSTNQLEQTQYRAMLSITGGIKSTSREKMSNLLGLPPLETRRNIDKLSITYKITLGIAPSYMCDILATYMPPPRDNRRNGLIFSLPKPHRAITKKNFFYSALDLWNKLPRELRNQNVSSSLFKNRLVAHFGCIIKFQCNYFFGNRRAECILNRFLLDFSGLNADLFRHNIVQSPDCGCGTSSETLQHFLLECPNYVQERNTLLPILLNIPDLPNPVIVSKKIYLRNIFDLLNQTPIPSSNTIALAIQNYIVNTERF